MKIINRKATFDYQIKEKLEVGIKLLGTEVKAIRMGHADLASSTVRIIGNQAYLINARIFPYEYARPENYDPKRTRKLLMHKKEIIAIRSKADGANLTIVPISLYTSGSLIKLEVALGKSKKKFEKKESIKRKDIERDIQENLKGMNWFDGKSTLKTASRQWFKAVKMDQKLNAGENRIAALKAERDAILAELKSTFGARPAYALAA